MFFFFNDTATTEIYTLSLHDALPICQPPATGGMNTTASPSASGVDHSPNSALIDRKSTRLNSSHSQISYAVFCLKKKNKLNDTTVMMLACTILTDRCNPCALVCRTHS